jgi:signal transduction histidine kinase
METGNIELAYKQNFFSFEFVALNFTSPEKNLYAYKLEGFDKTWHIVSADHRYSSYTNLDPGKYLLRVKGSNNDGVWNEKGTSITIIITPPFWRTWWFRTIIIILLLGTAILIYNYRVKQLLKIERMRLRIASDLHDEIGSSIGSIVLRSRILQKEANSDHESSGWSNKSKEELTRIYNTSTQIAAVMRDIVWFINPEFDKLDDMILRMKDTTQSLLAGIQYDFTAPAEVLKLKLSLEFRRNIFLCYKEILHNIIKHSRADKVKIDINISGRTFFLSVSDNGVGFNVDAVSPTNGMKNLKRRTDLLNGQLTIQSAPGNGTEVKISVKTT